MPTYRRSKKQLDAEFQAAGVPPIQPGQPGAQLLVETFDAKRKNDLGGGISPLADDAYTRELMSRRKQRDPRLVPFTELPTVGPAVPFTDLPPIGPVVPLTNQPVTPTAAMQAAGISVPAPDPLANEPPGSPARIAYAQQQLAASQAARKPPALAGDYPAPDIYGQQQQKGKPTPQQPKQPTFRERRRDLEQRTSEPKRVTGIDSSLIVSNPAESFNVMRAQGANFGDVVELEDGAAIQMGRRGVTPMVMDERTGEYKDREEVLRTVAGMLGNNHIASKLNELDELSAKVGAEFDPEGDYTMDQWIEARGHLERGYNKLAREAVKRAVVEKTPQEQYTEGKNVIRAEDGSVWSVDPETGAPDKAIVKAKHERQLTPKDYGDLYKVATEQVDTRLYAEVEGKKDKDGKPVEARLPTTEEIVEEMQKIMDAMESLQAQREQGGEQSADSAPAKKVWTREEAVSEAARIRQENPNISDFDLRRELLKLGIG